MRYLVILKGTQPAGPPPDGLMDAIMQLGAEASSAGALLDNAVWPPVPSGARVTVSGGELSVMDGPFAEAKEYISYAVYDVRAKEEAVEWASRFMRLPPRSLARVGGRVRGHQDLRPRGLPPAHLTRRRAPALTLPDPVGEGRACDRERGVDPAIRRSPLPTAEAARRTVEAVWRTESGRLVAGLARMTGDVGAAEEMAQEALVAALVSWPVNGIPPNPAGWLMTTAKNRAIDAHRRDVTFSRKAAVLARDVLGPEGGEPSTPGADSQEVLDASLDDHIGDDLLRLVFTACHPALSPWSPGVALTLRCLGGLSTDEIGRAFLVSEATAAQRIVRAKKTLVREGIRLELPSADELSERLSSVLEVVYLVFNEGYAATSGEDWMRPELCSEGMRLGRLLAALVPGEPEVHGLLALMELQASRLPARTGPTASRAAAGPGPSPWDRLLIRRGLESLARAESFPGRSVPTPSRPASPRAMPAPTARTTPTGCGSRGSTRSSSAVALAVVRAESRRRRGLLPKARRRASPGRRGRSDRLASRYPHVHAVRGDLLDRAGRREEAVAAFALAAELSPQRGRAEDLPAPDGIPG